MNLLKKIFLIITFLIVALKSHGQEKIPTYILASKYFHNHNSLGVAVRFDGGIDSISFPIDTNKIKVNLKKLDIEGKTLSDIKVYYEYQFTPRINGTYKLPDGIIWFKKKSFNMIFNDSIHLSIPDSIIKISATDSINAEIEKLNLLKRYNKEREETIINSRIVKKGSNRVILWTDYNQYIINDEIRMVVEVNTDFDFDVLKMNLLDKTQIKLKLLRSSYNHIIENGKEFYYAIFIFNALEKGIINIPKCKVKTKKRELESNSWQFLVTDN